MALPNFQDMAGIFFRAWGIINVYPLLVKSTLGTIKFIRLVYRAWVSLKQCHGRSASGTDNAFPMAKQMEPLPLGFPAYTL